jgi:hypothetical protein
MNWAKYADIKTKEVIAHPGGTIAVILIFAFIAGGNITEILENQHRNALSLISTPLFVFLPIWLAYFVVQAIRVARER